MVVVVDNMNGCSIVFCKNGGICVDRYNDYLCLCIRGYLGKNCDIGKNR